MAVLSARRVVTLAVPQPSGARARAVVDEQLMLPGFRQLLGQHARDGIHSGTGRGRHHEPNALRRIRLCIRHSDPQTGRGND